MREGGGRTSGKCREGGDICWLAGIRLDLQGIQFARPWPGGREGGFDVKEVKGGPEEGISWPGCDRSCRDYNLPIGRRKGGREARGGGHLRVG